MYKIKTGREDNDGSLIAFDERERRRKLKRVDNTEAPNKGRFNVIIFEKTISIMLSIEKVYLRFWIYVKDKWREDWWSIELSKWPDLEAGAVADDNTASKEILGSR